MCRSRWTSIVPSFGLEKPSQVQTLIWVASIQGLVWGILYGFLYFFILREKKKYDSSIPSYILIFQISWTQVYRIQWINYILGNSCLRFVSTFSVVGDLDYVRWILSSTQTNFLINAYFPLTDNQSLRSYQIF